ncbi:MAG: ATP-binding protein [Desulfococcaceae bacterium]
MENILPRIIADFHERPYPALRRRRKKIPLDTGKIITIVGPRRAGKTYFLFQLMGELEARGVSKNRIIYLNFEDERLDLAGDYDRIFQAYLALYPDADLSECHLFFDEIQELPNWEKFVRRVYDTHTRRIFLTGSNARFLSTEIATALRGRSLSFEIFPLSFREYLDFREMEPEQRHSTRGAARFAAAFRNYATWGGFPELTVVEDSLKAQILQEYFHVMIYRDLVERYAIRDVSVLKYLLKRMIAAFTREFSINRLFNDLKSRGFAIGKDHLYALADQVFSIYMLASVEKYDPSVVRREMSNRKIYLHDNGFASISHYAFFQDRGKLLENLVYSHLRRHADEIFFAKNGGECDFLAFSRGLPPLAVQVTQTLTEENRDRELRGFGILRKPLPSAAPLLLIAEPAAPDLAIPEDRRPAMTPEWLLRDSPWDLEGLGSP